MVRAVVLLALCGAASGQEAPRKWEPPPGWPPKLVVDTRAGSRLRMVRRQIIGRGVSDKRVLDAMRAVPRHLFVPVSRQAAAYQDRPLAIGYDQTISQPYMVASMTEELRLEPGMKVLEIGTGSGYQAAVLGMVTPFVFSIEIKEPLHRRAAATLRKVGFRTVRTRPGDGYYGWEEQAPFDAIMVTAAVPHVPPLLVRQLRKGGRMILPVGDPFAVQDLRLVTKDKRGRVRTRSLYSVRFVPMTGTLGKRKG